MQESISRRELLLVMELMSIKEILEKPLTLLMGQHLATFEEAHLASNKVEIQMNWAEYGSLSRKC